MAKRSTSSRLRELRVAWRALRVRKMRGTGPFLLAASVLAMVLGPNLPAVADQDDGVTPPFFAAAPPAVTPPPAVTEAAAPTGPARETLVAELHLGTRLTALGVMRLPPSPELVAAVEGEAPTHLLWPVEGGNFGRGFGYTRAGRPDLAHLGVDINAPEGTPVRAAAAGLVVYAGDGIDGFGNFIVIQHANGWGTSYAHNSAIQVEVGQQVREGEQIALVGQTGLAHGPHVHFEFYERQGPADPTRYFEGGPPHVQRLAAQAQALAVRHRHWH